MAVARLCDEALPYCLRLLAVIQLLSNAISPVTILSLQSLKPSVSNWVVGHLGLEGCLPI